MVNISSSIVNKIANIKTEKAEQILRQWCESLAKDDIEAVINGLSEAIIFYAPQNEYNKAIPYLGKKRSFYFDPNTEVAAFKADLDTHNLT